MQHLVCQHKRQRKRDSPYHIIKEFCVSIKRKMPGPASTVGDRPPMNPVIQVRFPFEVDGFFFGGGKYMSDIYQFELLSSAKN